MVLLIMVVMTTVGVSVASRSVSELRLSRQEQESTRSLNLSESGVEQLLTEDLGSVAVTNPSGTITVDGNPIDYTVTPQNAVSVELDIGRTIDVTVAPIASAVQMSISWTGDSDSGVVVSAINGSGTVRRQVYAKASVGGDGLSGGNIVPGALVNFSLLAGDETVRIKAIRDTVLLTVSGVGAWTLPTQGYTITTKAPLADGTTRAVRVDKYHPRLPTVFDYTLFSGGAIDK